MPRSAGEADKLGNFYEGIWTTDSLLDLLSGDCISVTLEPIDQNEGKGVEFVKVLPGGIPQYHSVKRQTVGDAWSLAKLTRAGANYLAYRDPRHRTFPSTPPERFRQSPSVLLLHPAACGPRLPAN